MRIKIIILLTIFVICLSVIYFSSSHFKLFELLKKTVQRDPWRDVPCVELALRMNSNPKFVKLYTTWFLKTLKLFWPEDQLKLTLVLDEESKNDHRTGEKLSKMWPRPNIVYLKPGNTSMYDSNQRRRMFLSYFYPENYVTADYVGFVDADTMFTTVITPEMLFTDGKPTVQARIGEPFWQQHWECWSDVTEYFLGEKEALQCMSYFPIIIKVQHIIELRKFAEKRFHKPFLQIFRNSFHFENDYFKGTIYNDCMCQFSVICNYIWYHHREEYDFHLQMTPDDTWYGEHRRDSQQTINYLKGIDQKYKVPKPRVAIHARHYTENGEYISGNYIDINKEPYFSQLERKVREGLCFSVGFDRCPKQCYSFEKTSLQITLYSFEMFDWIWDPRCLDEQRKHYKSVEYLIRYNEEHGKRMFGLNNLAGICEEIFSSEL